jgi:hypothetical protein
MTPRALAAAALVVFLGSALVDAWWGVEVTYVLPPQDASAVGAGHLPGDDPARRHGVPVPGGPERVLLLDRSRLVTPAEDPARRLYVLDATLARPRAARTLWLLALPLMLVLLGVAGVRRARQGAPGPSP